MYFLKIQTGFSLVLLLKYVSSELWSAFCMEQEQCMLFPISYMFHLKHDMACVQSRNSYSDQNLLSHMSLALLLH